MNLSIAARRPDLNRIFNEAPPMSRVGTPDDLKGAALYLLGNGSLYVTGLDLVVDGGMGVSSGNFKSSL
jgi:NAD(P)-dependent dehydrogenase (short-subunit alcohol dehydrogenase family)